MGVEIAALMSFFGLTSAFALIGAVLAAWMAWRIVEKAGFPGWTGLAAILLTLTAVASIVPLVLLWVFAFMRWPRDEPARQLGYDAQAGGPARPSPTPALAPPPVTLADRRGWRLTGSLPGGGGLAWKISAPPAARSSTGRGCCPSTARATSARPARFAWAASNLPCRGPEVRPERDL